MRWLVFIIALSACDPAATDSSDGAVLDQDTALGDSGSHVGDSAFSDMSDGGPSTDGHTADAFIPDPSFCPEIASTPLARLTATQYRNTVEALFGETEIPALIESEAALPLLAVERYAEAAKDVAQSADLDRVVMCDDEACAEAFVAEMLTRATRRTPKAAQLAWLAEVYSEAPEHLDHVGRLRLVVEVLLQSPFFLYHLELGDDFGPGDWRWLTHEELAARLSYALQDSPPSDALLVADLSTPRAVATAAVRLVDEPRGRAKLLRFFHQWFRLDELESAVKAEPGFPRASLRRSADAFIESVVFGAGSLKALLTNRRAYVDADVAAIYGVDQPEDWSWITLDRSDRAGILTRAAFLAIKAGPQVKSPIHRGAFLRRSMLCMPLPPPPPNVNDAPIVRGSDEDDGRPVSLRELTERRTGGGECAGCHALINPAGFTLQNYDAWGRFETTEAGVDGVGTAYEVAIDATGALPGTALGAIDGPIELSAALARSAEVSDCVVEQWFEYIFDRPIAPGDACSLDTLKREFRRSGGKFDALVQATVTLDAFRAVRRAP